MFDLNSLLYGIDVWLLLRLATLTVAVVLWAATLDETPRRVVLRGWAVVWFVVAIQVFWATR